MNWAMEAKSNIWDSWYLLYQK